MRSSVCLCHLDREDFTVDDRKIFSVRVAQTDGRPSDGQQPAWLVCMLGTMMPNVVVAVGSAKRDDYIEHRCLHPDR